MLARRNNVLELSTCPDPRERHEERDTRQGGAEKISRGPAAPRRRQRLLILCAVDAGLRHAQRNEAQVVRGAALVALESLPAERAKQHLSVAFMCAHAGA